MEEIKRRRFLKSIGTGIAATAVAPALALPFLEPREGQRSNFGLGDKQDNSEEFWAKVKSQFVFAPGLHYFNNGSLGASPIAVQKATEQFESTLDGFPSKYMWGGWNDEKEEVRKKVADLFSVSKEEIALIHNTTEGMNLIARSFILEAGDEVILANHEHSSGRIPWEVWQEERGIKLIRPDLPLIPKTVEELVDVYRKAITVKTKVISMCHIVNTNGMMLPVKEVSEMAHKKGILVAVDGAQSAGMFKIDLHDLGCDFYTSSAHKWLFSPKGVGVFYSKEESQHLLKPLMVARGHTDKSIRRLENYNTRNLPEVLGMGASVDFCNEIGAEKIHNRTFELKAYFRTKFKNNSKFRLKSPERDDLSGSIQSIEVVGKNVRDIKRKLFDQFGIDTRPVSSFGLNALRVSLAIFITKKDIDYFAESLETLT